MAAIECLLFILIVFGFAYFRAPAKIWTVGVAITLIIFSVFSALSWWFLGVAWVGFAVTAIFANSTKFREKYFTEPFIVSLQKKMPPISSSERDAIDAGDVWWEKDLFCGRPNWKQLLKMPAPSLSVEEENFLKQEVEQLCQLIDDWKVSYELKDLPKEVWDFLKKERFFGLVIPKEYGGLGFSALAHSTIVVKIATRCVSAAVNTMVPNSLGPAELICHYGTEEQKNYYLPRLANGAEIPSFALTAPEAGSDASSITDFGIVCHGEYSGQNVLGIRLTWDKRYITLAPIATVLGLAFRMFDPEHLLSDKLDLGITLALIPTNHPGVQIGTRHSPMNLSFMNGPVRGTEVFIPMSWIIGGIERVGQGWRMIMESLAIGRSISLPALSAACGKISYRMTGAYARLRRQFNVPIGQFEGIEESLADIAGYTYLLEAARIMTAGAVDQKVRPAIASAIAKYHMTEMSRKIISNAMDIHAGQMIQMGPRNYLGMKHFSIPISITVEGANILTRNLIIFGQGAIRCHPYIQAEVELLSSKDASPAKTRKLDRLLMAHVGYTVSNFVRSLWMGITGGHLNVAPGIGSGSMAYYYRQLTRMSAALALLSDMTMLILGGDLKRKERTSARLGDMLSHLYLASTVLKYFHDQGKPSSDIAYVKWCVEKSLWDIQTAILDLLNNFPKPWLGRCLRDIIFPWGMSYRKPSDAVSHQIVSTMQTPSELRDRLTRYCFISEEKTDAMRRVEDALVKVDAVEPLLKKYQTAIRKGVIPGYGDFVIKLKAAEQANVLTASEAKILEEFNALYQEVIKVNEFSFDLNEVLI
jgi:acyl-CoA dehydrogenase